VPLIGDRSAIRARLERDRAWSVYALGDLAPGLFEQTRWHAAEGGGALLLLFGAFETPVLFAIGAPADVEPLLDEIADQPRLYLSMQPDVLPLVRARYRVTHEMPMWRMVLDPARREFAPSRAIRLTLADYAALTRLHADGEPAGEAPDFFAPYMVEQGVFYGIYEGGEPVATAGTHLVVPAEGVAAVGNVYTRRDRRGRGLAAEVTRAVVAELMQTLPPQAIIALNVKQANATAIRIYERLGFQRYCPFFEGLAAPLV
jgi:ribosomal protein S18 acetylase RimI-like enzyme